MKGKSRLEGVALPAFVSFFLIVVTSCLFILQMNKMIESNTLNTISELAEHDMAAIVQFVSTKWDSLANIGRRLKAYGCDTVHSAQERLNLERGTSSFYGLFLIGEDGAAYSDKYMVYRDDELGLLEKLDWQGRSRIVRRFDYATSKENQREMLLYAVRLENFQIEGKKFTALVGITNITRIQDNLIIYYFKDGSKFRGYSSVVNQRGDYIVNIRKTFALNQMQNLFDMIQAGTASDEWSPNAIVRKMQKNERFRFDYTDADGISKLLYFIPIENTPWYFISMVERSVFVEQTSSFIFTSLSMLLVALAIATVLGFLVLRSRGHVLEAKADSKARSEFLSNMSHEIRTPLNGIIGLLYLMRSRLREKDTEQMEVLLGKADDSAGYLLSLVSDILDVSKLQAEKLRLNPQPFNLYRMLASVADMQRSNIERQGVTFEIDAKIPTPYVIGDEVRLKQVLMNIIGNSAKFTRSGGKISMVAFQALVQDERVATTIVCSDTGIGMSEEFQKSIWDSFTQEHNRLSNGVRGTGLGMAISKGIIDAMGGTISVRSRLNVGTVFTIELNLPVSEAASIADERLAAEHRSPGFARGMRLLVAEDNELNLEILTDILEDKGFSVSAAENGRDALDSFLNSGQGEFRAILMDMQMPVMDGCEAARRIRASGHPDAKKVRIFACTANVFQEDKDRAFASGMDDFLIKPIDVDSLLEKLAEGTNSGGRR